MRGILGGGRAFGEDATDPQPVGPLTQPIRGRAFGPREWGSGLRPESRTARENLVASDMFTMSSLSIGVRSSADVARGF